MIENGNGQDNESSISLAMDDDGGVKTNSNLTQKQTPQNRYANDRQKTESFEHLTVECLNSETIQMGCSNAIIEEDVQALGIAQAAKSTS